MDAATALRIVAGFFFIAYLLPFALLIIAAFARVPLPVIGGAVGIFLALAFGQFALFRAAEAILERRLWGIVLGATFTGLPFVASLTLLVVLSLQTIRNISWRGTDFFCTGATVAFLSAVTFACGRMCYSMIRAFHARSRLDPRRSFGFEPVMKVDDPVPEARAFDVHPRDPKV